MDETTCSLWLENSSHPAFKPLSGPLEVEVTVVGAGITGLTTAYLLKKAGKKVAVIDQQEIGSGETGHTTAHLTEMIDARFGRLIPSFGLDQARLAARSGRQAIDEIERIAAELSVDCDFKRVPGFLYAETEEQEKELRSEYLAAREAGVAAHWTTRAPAPFPVRAAIRVDKQARFHPYKYCRALALAIHGDGSHVFERTQALRMKDGESCVVETAGGILHSSKLVVATHSVNANVLLLQTKLAAYRSYAMAVKLDSKLATDGLFWDLADPYHYLRPHGDLWIIGGEDHRTGQNDDTQAAFAALESYARSKFAVAEIPYRWSGQILEPVDGLPYIGLNSASVSTFVAAGFSGNGMTFGTIAGRLISDLILKIANPYAKLFEPTRIKPISSAKDYVMENKDFPVCFVRDWIKPPEASSVEEIPLGEGRITSVEGKRAAVYRDAGGELHAVSSVCTHMACQVHFNTAEKSWDCPCHGSRFGTDGQVINGPATRALAPIELAAKKRSA